MWPRPARGMCCLGPGEKKLRCLHLSISYPLHSPNPFLLAPVPADHARAEPIGNLHRAPTARRIFNAGQGGDRRDPEEHPQIDPKARKWAHAGDARQR